MSLPSEGQSLSTNQISSTSMVNISIYGWNITTSGLEKQTSTLLEFYFRFWSRPLPVISMSLCITRYRISSKSDHPPTAEIWRHFHFSRRRPRPLNSSSGFIFVDATAFRRSKSISKPISSTYVNWWLRYNYFRFWKTNVRHIGNLPSVSISTIYPKSAHYSASGYRMSSQSKHALRKYDVISISQDGGREGCILLPVSYLLLSLLSEGQSLLAK